MNWIACHTAAPIPNQFGQRFLEIGYQLLGTEDGGIIGKKKQCEVTIDYVTNYSGFRIVGNAIRSWRVSRSRTLQALTPGLSKTRRISRFLKISCCSPAARWLRMSGLWWNWAMMLKGAMLPWSGAS
jgi:hypothetical protein